MTNAIVGYTGFVGSNLLQFYKFDHFYNSKNFNEAMNKTFDTIYFCGVPAVKWYANKYSQEDSDIIENIKTILRTVKVNKFILISTIDVYEYSASENNEDYACDFINNHPYGRNRYMFEYFISKNFINHHIIRLPALFGKGLKKNIIYDLINNNQLNNISVNTIFQWYDLNWLKEDIDKIIQNNIKICNLFTEPLETIKIIELFDYNLQLFDTKNTLKYNIKTKYSTLFNSSITNYIRTKDEILNALKKYLSFTKINKLKLCVSNICIKSISNFQFACILKLYGIQNVQIAPTTLIKDWTHLDNLDLSVYKNNNINIYSFQSITFTLNNLNIFSETRNELLEHIKKVIDCAIKNNIKVLVFGCPRNRKVLDCTLNNDELFCNFFKEVGNYIGNNKLIVCIEPNSKQYGCNYINTIEEAGKLVEQIDNTNIKMMVDIGNAIMDEDNLNKIYDYKDLIYNIDIAQENMINFIKPHLKHSIFKNILNDINYDKMINLEMLINDEINELKILNSSLNNFILL